MATTGMVAPIGVSITATSYDDSKVPWTSQMQLDVVYQISMIISCQRITCRGDADLWHGSAGG